MSKNIRHIINDFPEPYTQDTAFAWANVPCLSLFLPKPERERQKSHTRENTQAVEEFQTKLSRPTSLEFTDLPMKDRGATEIKERKVLFGPEDRFEKSCAGSVCKPCGRLQRGKRKSHVSKSKNKSFAQEDAEVPRLATSFDSENSRSEPNGLDQRPWTEPMPRTRLKSHNASKEPSIPFREQFHELEKRFREQMEVHRSINAAMQQLDTVEGQVRTMRAQQRTIQLVERLRLRRESILSSAGVARSDARFATTASTLPVPIPVELAAHSGDALANRTITIPAFVAKEATSTAASNPIKGILEAFSKLRDGSGKKKEPLDSPDAYLADSKFKIEIISPPKASQPYKVVHWVPVSPTARSDISLREESESNQVVNKDEIQTIGSTPIPKSASEKTTSQDAYTEDFEPIEETQVVSSMVTDCDTRRLGSETNSVETDIVITNSISPNDTVVESHHNSVITQETNLSAIDSIPTTLPSDSAGSSGTMVGTRVSSDIQLEDNTRHARGKAAALPGLLNLTDSHHPFTEMLRQFYQACQNANYIVSAVCGGYLTLPQIPPSSHPINAKDCGSADGSSISSGIDKATWENFVRDAVDLRRLQRFAKRLTGHLKHLDLCRRVQERKKKLLVKVQRLSRTRRRLRENSTLRLKDVEDYNDVEDISSESVAIETHSHIEDEIEDVVPMGSESRGSVISEINEEVLNDEVSLNNVLDSGMQLEEEIIDEMHDSSYYEKDDRRRKGWSLDDSHDSDASVEELFDDRGGEDHGLNKIERYVASRFAEASSLSDVLDVIDLLSDNLTRTITSRNAQLPDQSSKETVSTALEVSFLSNDSWQGVDKFSKHGAITSSSSTTSQVEGLRGTDVDIKHQTMRDDWARLERAWIRTSLRRVKAKNRIQPVPTFTQLYDPNVPSPRSSPVSLSTIAPEDPVSMIHHALNDAEEDKADDINDRVGEMALLERLSLPPRVHSPSASMTQHLFDGAISHESVSERLIPIDKPIENPEQNQKVGQKEKLPLFLVNEKVLLEDFDHIPTEFKPRSILFSHRNRCAEDELSSLSAWKDEQKTLVRQLIPKSNGEVKDPDERKDFDNTEESFERHFSIFETLLKARFGTKRPADYD